MAGYDVAGVQDDRPISISVSPESRRQMLSFPIFLDRLIVSTDILNVCIDIKINKYFIQGFTKEYKIIIFIEIYRG